MKLRADNIQKVYGKRKVVQGISLEVKQGEIIGLLGPNGAGKTTSFYMIVGMVKPNDGHIYLDDEEITNDPMYKRAQKGIGYLAQEASVFRKLSVEENIKIVSECLGKPVEDVTVSVLDRQRHEDIISSIRKMGARINLIGDGDVSSGIATCIEDSGIDILLGTGGAPEGVITAAALKCLGGDFIGRLMWQNEAEKERALKMEQIITVLQPKAVGLQAILDVKWFYNHSLFKYKVLY